jgi:hypothetical protein
MRTTKSDSPFDATDLKIELAALKRELRIEDEEHHRTVARINKDIKQVEKELRTLEKKGK